MHAEELQGRVDLVTDSAVDGEHIRVVEQPEGSPNIRAVVTTSIPYT